MIGPTIHVRGRSMAIYIYSTLGVPNNFPTKSGTEDLNSWWTFVYLLIL